MDQGNPNGTASLNVWHQWNQALARKLTAGGQDLGAQAEVLSQAAQVARARGDKLALWAALNALTKINLGLQRIGESKDLAEEALPLALELYGPLSSQAGTVISDLVFIEALEGREGQALALAERLRSIVIEQATRALDQAFSYNITSLATFHAMRGDDQEVERIMWAVIQRGEDTQGAEEEPDLLLFVYRNLSDFYRAQGRTDKAEQTRLAALSLMERAGYPLSETTAPAGEAKPEKATLH